MSEKKRTASEKQNDQDAARILQSFLDFNDKGLDEFCRFLAPYGRFRNYLLPDGTNRPFGFQPELEDSMEQRIAAVEQLAVDLHVFVKPGKLLGCEGHLRGK